MPLVFVHGVNVRRDPAYDSWVEERNKKLLQFLYAFPPNPQKAEITELGTYLQAAPRTKLIWNPYWGDAGAIFKFDHGALPKGRVESLGDAEDAAALLDVLERAGMETIPKEGHILSTLGQQKPNSDSDAQPLDNVIDLLWACLPPPTSPEEAEALARLAALATIYSARHPQPEWLTTAADDNEVILLLIKELAAFTEKMAESETEGPEEFGKISDGLAALPHAALVLSSRLASAPESVIWSWKRSSFHRFTAQFMGDVMTYLVHRGTPEKPGEIIRIILNDLREAKGKTPLDRSDPLIVIAHSMGGNIVYDILTSYAPDLQIDLLITVGSQVGLFEELSLFRSSRTWQRNDSPPKLVSRPSNVSHWLNVYDRMDPVGFAVERVFEGASDLEYRTGLGLALSHTHYFTYPNFYRRLAVRVKELLS